MAAETPQSESETTQQPLYRVTARHIILSSDPPEESEPLPFPRHEQPSTQSQLGNGATSVPGPHAFTSSLPESMSLVTGNIGTSFEGQAKRVLSQNKEVERKRADGRADEGETGQPVRMFLLGFANLAGTGSQHIQGHSAWRTSHTPLPSSPPSHRTLMRNGDDDIDQLHSSSLPPPLGSDPVEDAPEVPDPVDAPRDSAPFVESPPESTSPQPHRGTRKSARTTPKKAITILAPTVNDSRQPISTFSPSPMKTKTPYARQNSVPAPAHPHRSPFNKASRVFGRTRSDRAPVAEEDVQQDSFTNDRFLNPRQRIEKLERRNSRPSKVNPTIAPHTGEVDDGGADEGEATDTEEQHNSHFVSQSLEGAPGDIAAADIDAAFAEMDNLQATYKNSSPVQELDQRSSSESPTPQRAVPRPPFLAGESLEESSHRDLFAETADNQHSRLQRFDMPSSAESSRLGQFSQLATTSEKAYGYGDNSQAERSIPATQFVGRSPSKLPSSPSKEDAESPTRSTGVVATQITTSPTQPPAESQLPTSPVQTSANEGLTAEMHAAGGAQEAPPEPPVTTTPRPSHTTFNNGVTAVLPKVSAARQLTRSRPASVATEGSENRTSHTSMSASDTAELGPGCGSPGRSGITGSNGSSGAPSSRLTAARMLRRKSDKPVDTDAALYHPKQRNVRSATPLSTRGATSPPPPFAADVEATQTGALPTTSTATHAEKEASGVPSASAHVSTGSTVTRPLDNLSTDPGIVRGTIMAPPLSSVNGAASEPSSTDGAALDLGLEEPPAHVPPQVLVAGTGAVPAVSRLRAPLQPEASSLLTPLPSSSPSRPSRNPPTSAAARPAFRAALLESSPPRDLAGSDNAASEDRGSKPSEKTRTLDVPPAKTPPRRQYGKRPARERKQTTRAKEGMEQERKRQARKSEQRKVLSPTREHDSDNEEAHSGVLDDMAAGGKEAAAADGNVVMSDDDVSSATTASDPEDNTFRMTQPQRTGRKQKRRRESPESDDEQHEPAALVAPRRKIDIAEKAEPQAKPTKGKKTGRPGPSTPSRAAPSPNKGDEEEEDDGYVSPETPIDADDHTFQPRAMNKRKRGSSSRLEEANGKAGRSTRGSSTPTERALKRRKTGRSSRGGVHGPSDDAEAAAEAGTTKPNRTPVTKRKANGNGSGVGRKKGGTARSGARVKTPVPNPRATTVSTPLSSLPGAQPTAMRVLAHWASGQWFVGSTDGTATADKITVDFDDKTRGTVSVKQMRRFELRQGDHIGSTRPPREGGVVADAYVDDKGPVLIVTAGGKRKKVPIASVYITTANVNKQWKDRLPDFAALGLPSPFTPTASPSGTASDTSPFKGMRFLLTIDKGAAKSLAKDDLKSAIVAGGGKVVEDWEDLFDLPSDGFGSTLTERGPVFCIVHGAQSTKPKPLVALAAGIPCVASEWINDALQRNVDWRSYLVCAGYSESLDRDVSQVIDPAYGSNDWQVRGLGNCRRPFEGKKVLFVMPKDSDFEPVKRLVPVCLSALGASSVRQVPTASASEDLASYDYILVESRDAAFKKSKLPKAWHACGALVNTGWLKQCIVSVVDPPCAMGGYTQTSGGLMIDYGRGVASFWT